VKLYGLIGNPLIHSYSEKYFSRKFEQENIKDCQYQLFQLESENDLPRLICEHSNLLGLNVTIPFKQKIIKFLDYIDPDAGKCGAVNCIKIERRTGKPYFKGYNTDIVAFRQSIEPLLRPQHKHALILGTGGGALAAGAALIQLKISFNFVSRNPVGNNQIGYDKIDKKKIEQNLLIINATPIGMFGFPDKIPDLPYQYLTPGHLLFDLVYNPQETQFLIIGKEKGSQVKNGLEMLYLQAEKSWEIWSS